MKRTEVKAARKAQGACMVCGQPIEVGDAYTHVQPNFGPRKAWHSTCTPKPSQLETNVRVSQVMAAHEGVQEALTLFETEGDMALNDLYEFLEAAANVCRKVSEESRSAAEGVRGYLPESSEADVLEEHADTLEILQEKCRQAAVAVEEADYEGVVPETVAEAVRFVCLIDFESWRQV